jgi:hypothetical protein
MGGSTARWALQSKEKSRYQTGAPDIENREPGTVNGEPRTANGEPFNELSYQIAAET